MFFCPQQRDSTTVLHRIGETVIINRKKKWNSWNAIEVYVYSYVGTRQLFLVGITLLHVATWTQGVSALDVAIFKASASLSFSSNWKKTCRGESACFMLAREVHHVCPHPLAQMSHMSTPNSKEAGEYTDTPHFIMLHPLHFENIVFFCELKVHGNPASGNPSSTISPTALAQFMSLCHLLVILANISNFLLLLLYFLWWSVISHLWCYHCNCFAVPQTTLVQDGELNR